MTGWSKAKRQARAIGKTKTEAGKRRAILRCVWCESEVERLRERGL